MAALLVAGCTSSRPIADRSQQAIELDGVAAGRVVELPGASPAQSPELVVLTMERRGAEGRLPLRAVLRDRWGEEVLAVVDAPADEAPEPLWLPPGNYQLMVYARPGPFGCNVILRPGNPVHLDISSAARSQAIVVETAREHLGGGLYRIDRQILGFGWSQPTPPGPVTTRRGFPTAPARPAPRPAQRAGETPQGPRGAPTPNSSPTDDRLRPAAPPQEPGPGSIAI